MSYCLKATISIIGIIGIAKAPYKEPTASLFDKINILLVIYFEIIALHIPAKENGYKGRDKPAGLVPESFFAPKPPIALGMGGEPSIFYLIVGYI